MEKFKVKVTTTFYYEEEVEANTPEEAKKIMEEAIFKGEVDAVTDTVDPDTIITVEECPEPDKKNGWQVAIDLTGDDQESNLAILSSPVYSTEGGARNWYDSLDFGCYELGDINKGLDVIMIHWVKGQMEETYLLN